MGAYLRNLMLECAVHGCKSRATVEVVDGFNSSRGCFCRRHGQERLRELKRIETRVAGEQRSQR